MLRLKLEQRQKYSPVEYAIMLCCIVGLFFASGCSRRYAQITRPDGTEIILELQETLNNKKIQGVEVMIDKETGEYSFAIKGYNSETSPVVTSILKAVYEAGKTAGGI